jgi:hypothetical protein
MISRCCEIGRNPYTINVITFSGHGITSQSGDAIAVIPEFQDNKMIGPKILRFINFTDWARRFAEKRNTLTIFILSMCRGKVEIPELSQKIYENLSNDAQAKYPKGLHFGYSLMLFGTRKEIKVPEGVLMNKFFENYNKVKLKFGINMGWELINEYFCADHKEEICTMPDS